MNGLSKAVTYAAMWLAVGAAVVAALFLTERLAVMWFFLIPFFAMHTSFAKTVTKDVTGGVDDGKDQN